MLGPELRLSDGARPRYAGPHPIYRQPLQGHPPTRPRFLEEIVKVSVYLHEGVEKYADRFVPRWQQANCAVARPVLDRADHRQPKVSASRSGSP